MLTIQRLAIGVPLLVVCGIAAQTIFGSKVSGDMVAAHWADPSGAANVDVTPADTSDGRAYFVFWRACTFNPDFAHRYCVYAGGLAPKSAIKTERVDQVGLDLDASMLTVVFTMSGEDCTSGVCIPFVPVSVPLKGTFTIYRGPGSYLAESHGTTRRDDFVVGGFTFSQAFNGTKIEYSATFAGTVGSITVPPVPPPPINASLTVMKGQQVFQTVYPQAP